MPSVPDNGHADMFESVLSLWDSITLGDCPGALLQNSAAGVNGRVSRSALCFFGQVCALTSCFLLDAVVSSVVKPSTLILTKNNSLGTHCQAHKFRDLSFFKIALACSPKQA